MVELHQVAEFSQDDGEAFIAFERLCRDNMKNSLAPLDINDSWDPPRMEYMSRVQAASEAYGVDPELTLQRADDRPLAADDFDWFNHAVLKLVTHLQVRSVRRKIGESVELEPADKAKIKAEVERLRQRVNKSDDLSAERKTAICKKLDELLAEIEKPRVRFAAVWVILAAFPTAFGKLEDNAIKLPEAIAGIMDTISLATGTERQRLELLERYRKPKAIEHKVPVKETAAAPRVQFSPDLDDEIPF